MGKFGISEPSTVFTYTAGTFRSMNFLSRLVGFMWWYPRMEQFFQSQTRMLDVWIICLLRLNMATWTRANVGMSYFLHGLNGASGNVIILAVLHNCAISLADSAPKFFLASPDIPIPIYPNISQSAMSSSRQVLLVGVHLCGMLSIYAARLFKKAWQPRYFLGSPRWMI